MQAQPRWQSWLMYSYWVPLLNYQTSMRGIGWCHKLRLWPSCSSSSEYTCINDDDEENKFGLSYHRYCYLTITSNIWSNFCNSYFSGEKVEVSSVQLIYRIRCLNPNPTPVFCPNFDRAESSHCAPLSLDLVFPLQAFLYPKQTRWLASAVFMKVCLWLFKACLVFQIELLWNQTQEMEIRTLDLYSWEVGLRHECSGNGVTLYVNQALHPGCPEKGHFISQLPLAKELLVEDYLPTGRIGPVFLKQNWSTSVLHCAVQGTSPNTHTHTQTYTHT